MPIVERLVVSSFPAFAVTTGLFWLMHHLIAVEGITVPIGKDTRVVPFVLLHVTPEPIRTRPRRPRIIPPQPAPPRPSPLPANGSGPGRTAFASGPIDASRGHVRNRHRLRPTPADGDAIPLIRIEPEYPVRALRRGIEGRVLIEFSIGRSGAVVDPRVIASEPASVFDAAALEAIRKWRYDPRIENGVPVEQHGLRIAIPFRREGNGS